MGYAKQYADQLGKDSEAIIKRMTSGDYENIVAVFEQEFGDLDIQRRLDTKVKEIYETGHIEVDDNSFISGCDGDK